MVLESGMGVGCCTGEQIATMLHEDDVRAVAFSPDDSRLATASYDNTAKVWHWRPEDIIEEACSCLERKKLTEEEWKTYLPGEPYRETCDRS